MSDEKETQGVFGDFSRYVLIDRIGREPERAREEELPDKYPDGRPGLIAYWRMRGGTT